jgi:carbamoyl-phosphate synthase large subunit
MAAVEAEHYEILPAASTDGYLDALQRLVAKHKVQFVIPGSEPELIKLSEAREAFESHGCRVLVNAQDVVATCVDKLRTFAFLKERGFRVPETLEITDSSRLEDVGSCFPYVVKPARGGGGSTGTFIAQNRSELQFFVSYLLRYGQQPLVQEYVGNAECEYTVGVLHVPDGKLAGTVVLHRSILSGLSNRLRMPNRTGRTELGTTLAVSSGISQGTIVDLAPVRERSEAIAQALGSIGPLNLQGRWDGMDFLPFEINPRFSGTTPMRAMAGFNEPELLVDWYLGQFPCAPLIARRGEFTRGVVEHFREAKS